MTPYIIMGIVAAALGAIGFLSGSAYRRKAAESTIGSAEEEANRILSEAMKNAETKKKEALLEAKDEIHQLRQETERDLRERRSDVQRQEKRVQQKEETLDRKIDNLESKEEKLNERAKQIDEKLAECEKLKSGQLEMLEKISGLSKESAKAQLLEMLDGELTHEKAVKVMEYERSTKEESDRIARELVARRGGPFLGGNRFGRSAA